MKILHLLSSNSFSGAENVACQIISLMKKIDGYEMIYCSPDGTIRQTLDERDIRFVPLQRLSIAEVRLALSEQRPDVIHAHDMKASVIAAYVHGNLPVISHIHNSDFCARKLSAKSILYLLGSRNIRSILWVSESCFHSYRFYNFLRQKSQILYNIIDADGVVSKAMQDANEYDYDIVYVGRLAKPKNPMRLIRIIDLVRTRKRDVKVAIVGSGELEHEVHSEVERRGLQNCITFHGFMNNPLKVLACAKVMVMTSDREGLPMAALEAMALGVPIVSTPTDGLVDLVRPGITGYLEWDEKIFSAKVLSLITDAKERAKFSEATAEAFLQINDLKHYGDVLHELYRR